MNPAGQIALRPAAPGDEEFLRRLYAGTREAELAQIPWSAEQKDAFLKMQFEAQQQWYATVYTAAEHSVIVYQQQPIGRLLVLREADAMTLVDISLLAEYRGQGFGADLIERLIEEAKHSQRLLRLQVQRANQGAMRLYRKLGFVITGGDQMYCRMERRPPRPPISPAEISLREVSAADDAFLLQLYASVRADELTQVPWSHDQKEAFVRQQYGAQRQQYATEYPQGTHQIVCVGGEPVGRLYRARHNDVDHILDITIAPEHRNAGVGSAVLQGMMREASQAHRHVTIHLETFNPSLRLFRRLGFRAESQQGFQLLMRAEPTR